MGVSIKDRVAAQHRRITAAKRAVEVAWAELRVIQADCPHERIVGTMTMGESGSKCVECGQVFS